MKPTLLVLVLSLSLGSALIAAEPASLNVTCPISGKAANPAITLVYEGETYAFHDDDSRTKFESARTASLYHRIGGKAAIEAAVELFYKKVLADERVNFFFADISMAKQKRRQKEFLSAALGGPVPYTGKDMRKAHEDLDIQELHFNVIAEHLQATLEELKVDKELIAQAMAIVGSVRNAVLNRPETAQP